jgi:hypothetical protein
MPSLKFLNKYKCDHGYVEILDLINTKPHRVALSRLKCGNFNLRIRTGAWVNEETEEKVCRFCSSEEIEDEEHIFLKCNYFNDIRHSLLKDIQNVQGFEHTQLQDLNFENLLHLKPIVCIFAKCTHTVWRMIDCFCQNHASSQ